MSEIQLFLIEVVISISFAVVVIAMLHKPLRNLLMDLCESASRSSFWLTYSNLMLLIAPILSVMLFGNSDKATAADFQFFKTAFGWSLFGIFFSLAIIGLQISRSVQKAVSKHENSIQGHQIRSSRKKRGFHRTAYALLRHPFLAAL